MTPIAVPWPAPVIRQRLADYLALTKPRVVLMVLITTVAGFHLGSPDIPDLPLLAHVLLGTAFAAGGTLALNQYMERDLDARMLRTRARPLPGHRIGPREALTFGVVVLATGVAYLARMTTAACTLVTAAIAASYLGLYTPLKPRTSLCSVIGAVPGALPPVAGWAAARGALGPEPLVLFAIMFLWQIPHTLAIGHLHREDYARAGIRVLPVADLDGTITGAHALINTSALLPVALLPTLTGIAGPTYFVVALGVGLMFLWAAFQMARHRTPTAARRLLLASLVYLPVVLATMALDKGHF